MYLLVLNRGEFFYLLLFSDWESVCETEELTPKQDIYEPQSSQGNRKTYKLQRRVLSLKEEWKCEGHLEGQPMNQKACFKVETITHEEAPVDERGQEYNKTWRSFHPNTLLHTQQIIPKEEKVYKHLTHKSFKKKLIAIKPKSIYTEKKLLKCNDCEKSSARAHPTHSSSKNSYWRETL